MKRNRSTTKTIPHGWNNSKIIYQKVERGKIDTPSHSLFWLGTGTSIKSGGVKLHVVVWA